MKQQLWQYARIGTLALGLTNGTAVIVAFCYILFVLPNQTASQVASMMTREQTLIDRITEHTSADMIQNLDLAIKTKLSLTKVTSEIAALQVEAFGISRRQKDLLRDIEVLIDPENADMVEQASELSRALNKIEPNDETGILTRLTEIQTILENIDARVTSLTDQQLATIKDLQQLRIEIVMVTSVLSSKR